MPRYSEIVRMPGGGTAIVCYSGKQQRNLPSCKCGRRSTLQCDFPLLHGKTCDRYLCRGCAIKVGPDRDYCPDHPRE